MKEIQIQYANKVAPSVKEKDFRKTLEDIFFSSTLICKSGH